MVSWTSFWPSAFDQPGASICSSMVAQAARSEVDDADGDPFSIRYTYDGGQGGWSGGTTC